MEVETKEFTIFKLNMIKISFIYSSFLILWGVAISYLSDSSSFTSFIPSLLGVPILVLAFLSMLMPKRQKLFMHIVVVFGLIIFLGGADILRSFFNGGNPFSNYWAGVSKLMLLISGFLFCFLCIKSFRFARNNQVKST